MAKQGGRGRGCELLGELIVGELEEGQAPTIAEPIEGMTELLCLSPIKCSTSVQVATRGNPTMSS